MNITKLMNKGCTVLSKKNSETVKNSLAIETYFVEHNEYNILFWELISSYWRVRIHHYIKLKNKTLREK